MAEQDITSEEFATWLSPRDALDIAITAIGSRQAALNSLMERLKSGLIRSYAEKFILEREGNSAPAQSLRPIPHEFWRELYGSHVHELWVSGDATEDFRLPGDYHDSTAKFFQMRFDPAGLSHWMPKPPVNAAPETNISTAHSEPEGRGPHVSDAALKAWYAAYQLAYKEAEQTDSHAHLSAKGAFPGKTVTRKRVRELMPPRKSGPKGPRTA